MLVDDISYARFGDTVQEYIADDMGHCSNDSSRGLRLCLPMVPATRQTRAGAPYVQHDLSHAHH